jgi:hypothetical protein
MATIRLNKQSKTIKVVNRTDNIRLQHAGKVGPQGFTGPAGQSGSTGAQGTTGATGASGIQGATGASGATGPTGSVGVAGATGSQGFTGTQGATGVQGFTGSIGTQGFTGPQGIQGYTGVQGATGPQGATGVGTAGTQGATGVQGFTGSTGLQGFTGATGPQGATGALGNTGNPTFDIGTDVVTITGAQTLTNKTLSGLTITDATDIIIGTTTGTKLGTATTQKIGFFNATPVAQQANSTDIGTVLSNLGLRAVGANWGFTTSGSGAISGSTTLTGSIRLGSGNARTTTATLTVTTSPVNYCDTTTEAFTVTLPAANAIGGQILILKKIDVNANTVTIAAAGTDKIDGNATYSLATQYKYVTLLSDGTSKWNVIGNN